MGKTKDRGKSKRGNLACMIHEAPETEEALSKTSHGGQEADSVICVCFFSIGNYRNYPPLK
jgi:hypothetical protein